MIRDNPFRSSEFPLVTASPSRAAESLTDKTQQQIMPYRSCPAVLMRYIPIEHFLFPDG